MAKTSHTIGIRFVDNERNDECMVSSLDVSTQKKKKNVSLFLETVFELKHSQIVRQWPSCIRFNGTFHIENQDIAWHECVVLSAYASHIGYAKRRPTHWHTSIGDYQ